MLSRTRDDERDQDARVLRVQKANYARIGTEIAMRWREDVFVSDIVDGAPPIVKDA